MMAGAAALQGMESHGLCDASACKTKLPNMILGRHARLGMHTRLFGTQHMSGAAMSVAAQSVR